MSVRYCIARGCTKPVRWPFHIVCSFAHRREVARLSAMRRTS